MALIFLNLLLTFCASVYAETQAPKALLYPDGLIATAKSNHFSTFALIADKSSRQLSVYKLSDPLPELVAQYPADIGKQYGDKEKANDYRTPEGIYFLESMKTQPEIPFDLYGSLAFATDYPNIFDRRELKSGSGIWLHGVPDSVPLTRGSRGCVVVRNDAIKTLSHYVKLGQTPLIIYDKVPMVSQDDFLTKRRIHLDHFENWRTAWEQQDVDTYIKYYDQTFQNNQMNYSQWYKHKKKLKKIYKYIKVELEAPLILANKNQIVIRTLQKYASDLHQDYGEKTIHGNTSAQSGFLIVREDWKPLAEVPMTETPNHLASDKKSASAEKN